MRSVAPGPSCPSRNRLLSLAPSELVAIMAMSRFVAPVIIDRLTYSVSGKIHGGRMGKAAVGAALQLQHRYHDALEVGDNCRASLCRQFLASDGAFAAAGRAAYKKVWHVRRRRGASCSLGTKPLNKGGLARPAAGCSC